MQQSGLSLVSLKSRRHDFHEADVQKSYSSSIQCLDPNPQPKIKPILVVSINNETTVTSSLWIHNIILTN